MLSLKKEAEVFLSYVWLMLSVREVLNFIYNPTLYIDLKKSNSVLNFEKYWMGQTREPFTAESESYVRFP